MNMKKYVFLMSVGLMAFWTGCQKQTQVEEQKTMPICLDAVSMDQVFTSAESVLSGMQFQIEKSDRQAGRIITRPLRGAQFFEVWRQDNATAADAAESNLHSLQRTAEVRFEKIENQVCVNCRVLVQRLSLPDQPIRGMGKVSGQFTESSRRRQRLQVSEKVTDQAEWIYMGTDPALEELILKKIERAAGRAER
jgi:hypothetical protein